MAYNIEAARAYGIPEEAIQAEVARDQREQANTEAGAAEVGFLDETKEQVGAAVRGAIPFYDELRGAAGAGLDYVTGQDPNFSENYRSLRDIERQAGDVAFEERPLAYGAGAVAGSLIPGAGAIRGVNILGKGLGTGTKLAAGGAVSGAVTGYDVSTAEDIPGQLEDVATGAALGGATGALTPFAFRGLGAGARAAASAAKDVSEGPIGGLLSKIPGFGLVKKAGAASEAIKNLSAKFEALPEKVVAKIGGKPALDTHGDRLKASQADFIKQSSDIDYRKASREATSTDVPTYKEILETARTPSTVPTPEPVGSGPVAPGTPDTAPLSTATKVAEAPSASVGGVSRGPMNDVTGLPSDVPTPTIVQGSAQTRREVLERIASTGRYTGDPSAAQYLSEAGRAAEESNRTAFLAKFTKRTTGEERELKGHLGIKKFVGKKGSGAEDVRGAADVEKNLVTMWEPAAVTQESRGVRKMVDQMKADWKKQGNKVKDFPEVDREQLAVQVREKLADIKKLAPTPRRAALEKLLGKFEGSKAYRRMGVESISSLRPGAEKGLVEYQFPVAR